MADVDFKILHFFLGRGPRSNKKYKFQTRPPHLALTLGPFKGVKGFYNWDSRIIDSRTDVRRFKTLYLAYILSMGLSETFLITP